MTIWPTVNLSVPNSFQISSADFLVCLCKATIGTRFLGVQAILKSSELSKTTIQE